MLSLYGIHRAVVWAVHRITLTHGPMSVHHVGMYRGVITTIVAAEWSLRTALLLVSGNGPTQEPTTAHVDALQFRVLTTQELAVWFRIQIQMLLVLSQLSNPLTPMFVIGAPDLELGEGTFQPLVVHNGEVLLLAEWTWFLLVHNLLDTLLAIVLSAAAYEVRPTKDQQAYRAVRLD